MYEVIAYVGLPESLQGGMKRYIEDGIKAGGFLTACLENDLMGAVTKADNYNLPRLQDIARWLYNEAPAACWGSKENVAKWHGEKTVGELNRDIQQNMKRIQDGY